MNIEKLKQEFENRFGTASDEPISFVRAPGRVNLIGEHTDYNDGFVMPIAVNKAVTAVVRKNNSTRINLASTAIDTPAVIELDKTLAPAEPAWANYCRGVVAGLIDGGIDAEKLGCDILFDSDIPHGAGLSSSAALEVATALAIGCNNPELEGKIPAGMDLAKLCQKAEHTFAGTPCGIMDQAIVVLAKENSALLLDCQSGQTESINFGGGDVSLLVCDTQVKHELNDGGYALRRSQCEQAAEILGAQSLRQAFEEKIDFTGKLEGDLLKRTRHVVGEIARTVAAADALKNGNLDLMGKLMNESHDSLRDDYNVSCQELDTIVDAARSCDGVYGARMTGGGFGGSAIVLARTEDVPKIIDTINENFELKYSRKPPVFTTQACQGAGVVQ